MSMGKVYFPKGAPWVDAFPAGCGMLGLGGALETDVKRQCCFHHHKRNRGANIGFSVFAVFQLYGERITVAENHDR
jgi:hypothetical protein